MILTMIKSLKRLLLLATACLLVSCFGKEEKPEEAALVKPAKPVAASNPRPDRRPPPAQPQDGSMIVRPGGTEAKIPEISEIDNISAEDKDDALSAAAREITRRKQGAAEGDDKVSKALNNLSEDDIDRALGELRKAVGDAPKTAE